MNRGLEIRAKKLQKKKAKRNTIKDNQKGVCRFIDFKNTITEMKNGKFSFMGTEVLTGLQIENKFYYVTDGKEHWCAMNKKGTAILVIYSENEIENFPPQLIERSRKFKEQHANDNP